MKKFLKKNLALICIVGGLIILATLAMVIFSIINANKKLPTPENLSVITLADGTTYLDASEIPSAIRYEFVVISNGIETPLLSDKPKVEVSTLVRTPANYTIKVRALGTTEKSISDFASISYAKKVQISTPILTLGAGENINKLYFQTSNNFSQNIDLKFTLYYGINSDNTYKTKTMNASGANSAGEILSNDNAGNISGYFSLKNFENGEYLLGVKVTSTSEFYSASALSNQIIFSKA